MNYSAGDEPGDQPVSPAAVDAAFSTLADANRRIVLYYLRDHDRANPDELATVLTGWLAADADQTAVGTPAERRRHLTALHHVHLPKLAAAGLVEYDADAGEVAIRDLTPFVDATLDRSLSEDGHVSDVDDAARTEGNHPGS